MLTQRRKSCFDSNSIRQSVSDHPGPRQNRAESVQGPHQDHKSNATLGGKPAENHNRWGESTQALRPGIKPGNLSSTTQRLRTKKPLSVGYWALVGRTRRWRISPPNSIHNYLQTLAAANKGQQNRGIWGLLDRYNGAFIPNRTMCSISKMAAQAEGLGNDRGNLEEQSCHGLPFSRGSEWSLCAAGPSWRSGKTPVSSQTYGPDWLQIFQFNSIPILQNSRNGHVAWTGPTRIPLQRGSVYQWVKGKWGVFVYNCESGDGICDVKQRLKCCRNRSKNGG